MVCVPETGNGLELLPVVLPCHLANAHSAKFFGGGFFRRQLLGDLFSPAWGKLPSRKKYKR
jgi:hypothetical protein